MATFHHTLFFHQELKEQQQQRRRQKTHKHYCQPSESLAPQSGALQLGHHMCGPLYLCRRFVL